jgi:hypothetical protein
MIIQTLQNTIEEFDKSTTLQKPTKLYKYRTCTRNNINNVKNGKAWFSSPMSWNDKVDCTILLDLEKFCENYEQRPENMILESIKWIAKIFETKLGISIQIPEDKINEITKYFDNNGTLKKIGRGAFSDCLNLWGTIIWDGIEEIDSQVFEYCTNLKDLKLWPSIKRIGDGAFFGCNKLKVWYYGTIDQFRQLKLEDTHLTHVNCLLKNGGNDWALYKLH